MTQKVLLKLRDGYCKREVEFSTTFEGEGIDSFVEAFRSFLFSVGFSKNSIDGYLPEE